MAGTYSIQRFLLYGGLALLLAHVALRLDRRSVRLYLRLVLAVLVAQVLLGIGEATVLAEPIWGYRGGARENPFIGADLVRTQGTFGHPIVFGYFMALMAVLGWTNAAALSRRLRVLAILVAATGLFLSGTRSAVVAAAAAIALHLILRKGLAVWLRNVLLLGSGAAVAVAVGLGSTIEGLTVELLDSGSWVQRLGSLRSVPALLGRSPLEAWFGSGFGSDASLFERGFLRSDYHLSVVDDMFVEALATTGIIGLILLLTPAVLAFLRGDRSGRALVFCSVAMMFSFDTMVWLCTGVMATLVVCLPRSHDDAGGADEEPPPAAEPAAEGRILAPGGERRAAPFSPRSASRDRDSCRAPLRSAPPSG